eukprot:2676159-Rhodomonas_salina.2
MGDYGQTDSGVGGGWRRINSNRGEGDTSRITECVDRRNIFSLLDELGVSGSLTDWTRSHSAKPQTEALSRPFRGMSEESLIHTRVRSLIRTLDSALCGVVRSSFWSPRGLE